ncbi:Spo0E family sporulation regulatory protein-aspartic acid phosphatase [Pontibacillus sp. HMF3514]|nr:Spo0E family sporulation regulatory protein-aspartic acid phosphatase [Pontibacillus sp. HMF3514]
MLFISILLRGGPAVAEDISTQHLIQRIESLRKRMIKTATVQGFTSHESLEISQELDRLLNMYENRNNRNVLSCDHKAVKTR